MYVVYATTVRPDLETPFANDAPEFAEDMVIYNNFVQTQKDIVANFHRELSEDTLTLTDVYEFENFNKAAEFIAIVTRVSPGFFPRRDKYVLDHNQRFKQEYSENGGPRIMMRQINW